MIDGIPSELVSGGDCGLHHHDADRQPTRETRRRLDSLEEVERFSSSTTLRNVDMALADTSSGNVTLTLSTRGDGARVVVVKIAAPNTLTVAAPAGCTINGAASVALTAQWAALSFKRVSSTEWVAY